MFCWPCILILPYDKNQPDALFIFCLFHQSTSTCSRRVGIAHHQEVSLYIQGDQKVSVHLMITIQNVTSDVQSVSHQSPNIYWHAKLCSQRPFSVQHYITMVSDWNRLKYLCVFSTVIIRCTEIFYHPVQQLIQVTWFFFLLCTIPSRCVCISYSFII
jgi:hypothetical protein